MADSEEQGSNSSAHTNLADQIRATSGRNNAVRAALKTDERVLARVTDGIYRQPGSALRELISNAYDADATRVVVLTDRPRFDRISIEDDGHGMTADSLAHMLEHIGGSSKRTSVGAHLGVTRQDDSSLSPGGRRLIGKIGIGLFSVAQLTRHFQIITKVAGENVRTVANVVLKNYDEDRTEDGENGEVEAGQVSIWQESADHDVEAHGTTLILSRILPKTKQTLQSAGEWLRYDEDGAPTPKYHIGRFKKNQKGELAEFDGSVNHVPWDDDDDALSAFQRLVSVAWGEIGMRRTNPKLDQLFDHYLQMAWQLSISVPLAYVGDGPSRALGASGSFELRGALPSVVGNLADSNDPLWEKLEQAPGGWGTPFNEFRVFVDDLELRRPFIFSDLPSTNHAISKPLLFAGHLREEFSGIDRAASGGPLEFYAYFMWAPKIAPVDHVGALVRVHGASGTQFDPTFLKYQVAEIARLRQISCEIFVTEGFEAALNIDRESFNAAHPHAVRLTSWLHSALGRVIGKQKQIASEVRRENRQKVSDEQLLELASIARKAWVRVAKSDDDVPVVAFRGGPGVSDRHIDLEYDVGGPTSRSNSKEVVLHRRRLEAVVQVLAAYGFLEQLSHEEQEAMIGDVSAILMAGGGQ